MTKFEADGIKIDGPEVDGVPMCMCEVTLVDDQDPYYPVLLRTEVPATVAVAMVEDISHRNRVSITVRPVGRPVPGRKRTDAPRD